MRRLLGRPGRAWARRWRATGVGLGVGAALGLFLVLLQPFSSLEWRFSDLLSLPETPGPAVVVAAIDDASLATYGRWEEWPRSLHAQAIDNLKEAGARVITLDILFAEPSADDGLLAQAMARAGNVVLAAVGWPGAPQRVEGEPTYQGFLQPALALGGAAAVLGQVNIIPDGDGVVRRLPLTVRDQAGSRYPSLALAALGLHFSRPVPQEFPPGQVTFLDRDIPVDASRQMRINFAGPPGTFPQLSYQDVIQGRFDPLSVRHKIVLVGMTATAQPDSYSTPASRERMPGVEILANAMDTILRGRFLRETGPWATWGIILALAALLALVLPRLNLRWGLAATFFLGAGYVFLALQAYEAGRVLSLSYPLMSVASVYVASLLYRLFAEQAQRREIRDLFGRYVSPQVAQEVLKLDDAGVLRLGGEQREVSVLFADVRGFTALSERLSPEALVEALNTYLDAAIQGVLKSRGMINKFAGDNIMAVWNAPQPQEGHALLAVEAALEARKAVEALHRERPDLPPLELGFGINSGEAVAGNMGSPGRSEYTVIGDTVNLASRLCGAAPGGDIWIGPQTHEAVQGQVEVEALGPHEFKGKAQPVPVYRVLGLRPSPRD